MFLEAVLVSYGFYIMRNIDVNIDAGEYSCGTERKKEATILSMISRCNIACGGHAGNDKSMYSTLTLAKRFGVVCGAHPSYPDTKGFGRRTMVIDASDLKESLKKQICTLSTIARELGIALKHVKPHGALYNEAMQENSIARLIVQVVAEFDAELCILGMPNSALQEETKRAGLIFLSEGFIDRRYNSRGSLVSRKEKSAVIDDVDECVSQALALALHNSFPAADGTILTLDIKTLCIHGDNPKALEITRAIHRAFTNAGFLIG